jgi:hypothetical protein
MCDNGLVLKPGGEAMILNIDRKRPEPLYRQIIAGISERSKRLDKFRLIVYKFRNYETII